VAQGFIHFGKLALFCLGIDRDVPIWSGGRFGPALQDDSRSDFGRESARSAVQIARFREESVIGTWRFLSGSSPTRKMPTAFAEEHSGGAAVEHLNSGAASPKSRLQTRDAESGSFRVVRDTLPSGAGLSSPQNARLERSLRDNMVSCGFK
jgi:hypothetical protein